METFKFPDLKDVDVEALRSRAPFGKKAFSPISMFVNTETCCTKACCTNFYFTCYVEI